MIPYVHLHCASYYSLLRGTFSPESLVKAAIADGAPAVALSDYRGLYGAVPFYQAARKAGIHAVFGATFPGSTPGTSIIVIARNNTGYGSLCRLVSADQKARPKTDKPDDPDYVPPKAGPEAPPLLDLIQQNLEGVTILTSDPQCARILKPILPENRLFLEYYRGNSRRDRLIFRQTRQLAEELAIRGVATNRVHFLKPDDFDLHRVLSAIRLRKTVETLSPSDTALPGAWFRSQQEMNEIFSDMPECLAASVEIAQSAWVDLPIGRQRYPLFPPEKGDSPEAFLRRLCEEALTKLYKPSEISAARARMNHELDVICSMGYASYFLVVWDIVRYARQKGVPSTGRGSAADSIVSYLLDLTHVDPIKYNLYFERFLNRERTTPPDIDIDLCWRRRDDILEYVYERWGHENVAMISTHVTFAGRSCVREVGKAMGLSESEIGRYTRFLPHFGNIDFEKIHKERPESRHIDFTEEPLKTIIPMARRLEGFPAHLGVHPSGIVVSPEALTRWTPLEPAAKGLIVTQYDMYPVEDLGLLKIDLLGQRSLSVIADVRDIIREEYEPDFDFREFNAEEDEAARDLICAGRTMGVFQIESPGMRSVLRKVQARDFLTVTAASSVIRPGPKDSGMLHAWIRRHKGTEKAQYLHPRLKEVLAETHGIMLYQEDVLKVAQAIAGMSLGRADLMRRSMSGKRVEVRLSQMEDEFMEGARASGIAPSAASAIWKQMHAFAGYAFCKAHSASFTVLSFQSAWLKAHYPAEFMGAVLANGGGFYDRAAYVSEARRLGLRILLPSINHSLAWWKGRRDYVRCGLGQVKSVRSASIKKLIADRDANGPFRCFAEALRRLTHIEKSEWENLILSGACDDFLEENIPASHKQWSRNSANPPDHLPFRHRSQMLWFCDRWFDKKRQADSTEGRQLDILEMEASKASEQDSFDNIRSTDLPALPDYSWEEKYDREAELLGTPIRCHPLERFQVFLPDKKKTGVIDARDLDKHAGHRAKLIGWLVTSRRLRTSKGSYMKFLTVEDLTAIYEAILFDKAYQAYGQLTLTRGPYLLEGKVEMEEGYCSLNIDRLQLLREPQR